ncbi:MAG: hypothetical protein EU547_00170 [Promethearchaeota archaeon]|nr:MAG: hypothetical protein EU547_00170 [Candidatus Lokiarchaeota archaeon]
MFLKKKTYYHQNIKYSFHYHKRRLNNLDQLNENYKILKRYFIEVYEGKIPNDMFNMRNNPRISRFKLKGVGKAFLRSYSKKLIRSGEIKKLDSNKLSLYATNVYKTYQSNKIDKKPGHDPVLKNILINDDQAIAIETPIWKQKNGSCLTGHIDLIQITPELIRIVDYKPEGNFLYSLPQVASYGLIFKSNFKYDNIKCISFNKDEAWEYDPDLLIKDELKRFLTKHHDLDIEKWEKWVL